MKVRAAVSLTCGLLTGILLTGSGVAWSQSAERNTRHALIIGIGLYADSNVTPLSGVKHDMLSARRMAAAMAVPAANIRELRDLDATRERIVTEISALHRRMREGDRVFLYFSGHGTRWFEDSVQRTGCTEGLLSSDSQVITNGDLAERLAPVAKLADKLVVFYDTCFSGGVAGAPFRTRVVRSGDQVITPKFTRNVAPEQCAVPANFQSRSLAGAMQQNRTAAQNVVHIAASQPDEASFDISTVGGLATAAWRDCLLGEARDSDDSGAVTIGEVTQCAQVKVNAARVGQTGISGQNFTVAGNLQFVPAWMAGSFVSPSPASTLTPTPMPGPGPGALPTAVTPSVSVQPPLAPALAPAPALKAKPADILAEVHGQRDGARQVVALARQARLKIGSDPLKLDITSASDGYLYIALAGSDGQSLYLLYPNALASNNRVRAGQKLVLPDPAWEIVAAGPPGLETLLVMVTDAPRELATLAAAREGPFLRTLMDGTGRVRLQALLGNGTPAAGCGKPGQATCSDAFGSVLLKIDTVP